MRHRILTCKNHPHLRWSCKDVAWTDHGDGTGHFNGSRHIFFGGFVGSKMHHDMSGVDTILMDPLTGDFAQECACPPSDLVLAYEDRLVSTAREDRYANAHQRLTRASTLLLTDSSQEGQTLLQLLIDNQLYGDELMTAIETAERYLKEKGETL